MDKEIHNRDNDKHRYYCSVCVFFLFLSFLLFRFKSVTRDAMVETDLSGDDRRAMFAVGLPRSLLRLQSHFTLQSPFKVFKSLMAKYQCSLLVYFDVEKYS